MERMLSNLAGLSARTDAAEQRILDAAVRRLDEVQARIEVLRPDAALGSGDEYQRLILERGRLGLVIEQAKKNGARLQA